MNQKLKITFLGGVMLLFAIIPAKAFTVDDLVKYGGAAVATFTGDASYNDGLINISEGVTFEKISDTKVRITGLYGGTLAYDFELVNYNGGSAVKNGTRLQLHYKTQPAWYDVAKLGGSDWRMYPQSARYDYLTLLISSNSDEYLTLTSEMPLLIASTVDGDIQDPCRIYSQLEIVLFEPSGFATDKYVEEYNWDGGDTADSFHPVGTQTERTYPVKVEMDYNTNRFSILNLGNNGYGYFEPSRARKFQNYSTIPQEAFNRNGLFKLEGSFDPETHRLTFDQALYSRLIGEPIHSWGSTGSGKNKKTGRICGGNRWFCYQLERLTFTDQIQDIMEGTYFEPNGVPTHNNAPHGWVSNGGKRRTYEGLTFELDDYTYYCDQINGILDRLNFRGGYWSTVITDADITLQTSFVRSKYDRAPQRTAGDALPHVVYTQFHGGNEVGSAYYDGAEWGVVPVMQVEKNEKYVDNYELMAIPGTYTTADEVHAHINEAIQFDRVFANTGDGALHQTDNASFDHDDAQNGLYKPGDYRIKRKSSSDSYTFFFRANYKPETGLTPTYHDIYPYTFTIDLPTSTEITPSDNVDLQVENGVLRIFGWNGNASVFNAAGMMVYNGKAGVDIQLQNGIYLVRLGEKSYKIVVR